MKNSIGVKRELEMQKQVKNNTQDIFADFYEE